MYERIEEIETEQVLAQIKTLDVRDKLLVITSEARLTHSQLATIRGSVKQLGGLGVMYFPEDAEVKVETIDECIKQLQEMKRKAIKPSTKGIMTDPD